MVMFPYFLHPIVIMSTIFFAICLMVANYLMVGYSTLPDYYRVLTTAKTTQSYSYLLVYQFTLGHSGLTFIGPLLGIWLAIILCGILADRHFNYLTRKAGAQPKPETRLPLYAFTGPVGVAGTILFGVCTQNQCHWIAPIIGSFGCKHIARPLKMCSSLMKSSAILLHVRCCHPLCIFTGCV